MLVNEEKDKRIFASWWLGSPGVTRGIGNALFNVGLQARPRTRTIDADAQKHCLGRPLLGLSGHPVRRRTGVWFTPLSGTQKQRLQSAEDV